MGLNPAVMSVLLLVGGTFLYRYLTKEEKSRPEGPTIGKCTACGKDVSFTVKTCPHCGERAPHGKRTHPFTMAVAVIAGIIMLSNLITGGNYTPTPNYEYEAEQAVRASLKDPDSAKFGEAKMYRRVYHNIFHPEKKGTQPSVIVCGFVNSKNGFGAYAGDTPYITVDNEVLMYPSMPEVTRDIWKANCK